MEKPVIRKLQLTRETLRNLTTEQMKMVVGGTENHTLESECDLCQQSATCGCSGLCTGGCSGNNCYSGMCGSANMSTCSPSNCNQC